MAFEIAKEQVVGVSRHILRTHRCGRYLMLNRRKRKFDTLLWKILHVYHRVLCSYVGCYVPFSAKISRGIVLPHGFYGVFLSKQSVIGFGVTLLHQVTIGSNPLSSRGDAPSIGGYCFVGAGAKIIGNVTLPPHTIVPVNGVITPSSYSVLQEKK